MPATPLVRGFPRRRSYRWASGLFLLGSMFLSRACIGRRGCCSRRGCRRDMGSSRHILNPRSVCAAGIRAHRRRVMILRLCLRVGLGRIATGSFRRSLRSLGCARCSHTSLTATRFHSAGRLLGVLVSRRRWTVDLIGPGAYRRLHWRRSDRHCW